MNPTTTAVHRSPVYVAAPFGAPTRALRECNTDRAELLAVLARREGMAPLCVHSMILRGLFGDDNVPSEREAGMACSRTLLRVVRDAPDGRLWVLEHDELGLTQGVMAEVQLWRRGRTGSRSRAVHRRGTWGAWRQLFERHGLGSEWRELDEHHRALTYELTAPLYDQRRVHA